MKTLFFLFIVAASAASAQTNTFISFTNTSGVFVTNAEVAKIFPNKIIYRTSNGGGTIRIDVLPEPIQKQLGYNFTNAALADSIEKIDKSIEYENAKQQMQQLRYAARFNAQKDITEKSARAIVGRVIQRLDGGLLVSARPDDGLPIENYIEDELWKSWNNRHTLYRAEGILYLVDYPNHTYMAADDKFLTVAYPDGFFKYKTVNGSESIVRRYTSSLKKATVDSLADK